MLKTMFKKKSFILLSVKEIPPLTCLGLYALKEKKRSRRSFTNGRTEERERFFLGLSVF